MTMDKLFSLSLSQHLQQSWRINWWFPLFHLWMISWSEKSKRVRRKAPEIFLWIIIWGVKQQQKITSLRKCQEPHCTQNSMRNEIWTVKSKNQKRNVNENYCSWCWARLQIEGIHKERDTGPRSREERRRRKKIIENLIQF